MANKRIQIEFDLNTNEVKLAGEATLSLAKQVRILQQELQKTPEGTKEFELLRNKLNDTRDNFERVNAKSRELFGTLSLIPGPIGEIAGKLNGAVSLLKTFSGFSLKDVTSQFKALGNDIKGIFENFLGLKKETDDLSKSQMQLTDSAEDASKQTGILASNAAETGAAMQSYQQSTIAATAASKAYSQTVLGSIGVTEKQTLATQLLTKAELSQIPATEKNAIVYAVKNNIVSKDTLAQRANALATQTNTSAQVGNTVAVEADTTAKATNTVTTTLMTQATRALTVSAQILRGVLLTLPFIGLVVLVTMIVGKISELIDAMKQAKDRTEDYNRALERQKELYDDIAAGIDQQTKIDIERAKQAGKGEVEIFKIRKAGLERQLAETRKAANEAAADEAKFRRKTASELSISEEERINQINKFNARKQELFNKEIELGRQIELEGEQEKTRIAEAGRKKRDKGADDGAQKALEKRKAQLDAEIQLEINKANTSEDILEDLLKRRLELEKLTGAQLLLAQQENNKKVQEELEKDFEEKRQKKLSDYQALVEIEQNQADVDVERLIQTLGKLRDVELQELGLTSEQKKTIISKYEKEFRELRQDAREKELTEAISANRGNFEAQIELYRQFADEVVNSTNYTEGEKLRIIEETNQKIQQLNQERFQNELNELQLQFGADFAYQEEYYNKLGELYDQEEQRYKQLFAEKKITEAEYTEFLKKNRDARVQLQLDELKIRTETFQAIGDIFTASAQLAGEQSRAGKALAIAGATINTYAAANQVLADPLTPAFLKALKAAAIIINGLSNVRRIAATPIPNAPGMGGSGGVVNTGGINVNARRAQGGMVNGPGGETSDNIMALLSDGEYVVNARSTRAFKPLLETINSAQNLPAFAAGGLVNQGTTPFKSQNETIADAVSTAFGQTPIKTYVTATEVSNQQQFDRIIKSRSLI